MSIAPNKWTPLEPSVIRDAMSGRLGFQEMFGTTFVSGATNALTLKQNPIDGSTNEGDAYLYAGTANGGLYSRGYDYQTDTWDTTWNWISEPSGSDLWGYDGAQGVAAVAISPDGQFIVVGRGNSSNFKDYTPNGNALQIGQIQSDGTVDWLPVSSDVSPQSGKAARSNVRELWWQDDGLYATFSTGEFSPQPFISSVIKFAVDDLGQITQQKKIAERDGGMLSSAAASANSAVFLTLSAGYVDAYDSTTEKIVSVTSPDWEQTRQTRSDNGELLGRITVAQNPLDSTQQIVLLGWFKYAAPSFQPNYITHVDRLIVTSEYAVSSFKSLDFSLKAGGDQAINLVDYGNYALLFDPNDPTLETVLVGGNQYLDQHPDGQKPFNSTGGLVRGQFDQNSFEAVFGPYADQDNALVTDSLLMGAPHADSRAGVAIQTSAGPMLIQSDDGGVWLLSGSEQDASSLSWTSLNAQGLNSLEVMASAWDARSNSFVSSFQDNASSIGQFGDAYMNNVWAGDGQLALMDGAELNDPSSLSWAYLNSQQYMSTGQVYSFGLDERGDIQQTQVLSLLTNWQGTSVQPVQLLEMYALSQAYPDIPLQELSGQAKFSHPATTNPFKQGDIVFAGASGLYETFIPNESNLTTAGEIGTLGLVPVVPYSDAKILFTAVDLGSSEAFVDQSGAAKPFFWDSFFAVSWDSNDSQSTIWYRNPVLLEQPPATLADVNQAFLSSIALKPLTTSGYGISDIAHTVDEQGQFKAAYWLEVGHTLFNNVFAGGDSLQPTEGSDGAALVIYRDDGQTTRLPYAQTVGLNQLVLPNDFYGPTSLAILPGQGSDNDILVIGGEHGLYSSELNDVGMPVSFEPMNIAELDDGVQFGRVVSGINYSAQDDLLSASMLGGGTLLYSRTGELQPTPEGSLFLKVSQAIVAQSVAESTDKRGNAIQGSFAIELPENAFDAQGVAQVEFVINNADSWRLHIENVTFYGGSTSNIVEFNLLQQEGNKVSQILTFHQNATTRYGFFNTLSTAQELPPIGLNFEVRLLESNGDLRESVDSSIRLMPNGITPSFVSYLNPETECSSVFQARFSFGDGVNFQKLPYGFKVSMPADWPEGTQVFAFKVNDLSGAITLDSGTTYLPTDADYLTIAVPAQRIESQTEFISGPSNSEPGLGINALTELFLNNDLSNYLTSEGVYYGDLSYSLMPDAFDDGTVLPPLMGIAIQFPDGVLMTTTVDIASIQGNELNLDPSSFDRGVILDVGYGGIFAAQSSYGDIEIAKLGAMISAVGFVRLDDLFGRIGDLLPGDENYIQTALARSIEENLDLTLDQSFGSTAQYYLDSFIAGTYYASFITPGYQTVDQALQAMQNPSSTSASTALFSFDAANPSGQGGNISAAIPFAKDIIAFEDRPIGGDLDFNDVVIYYGAFI